MKSPREEDNRRFQNTIKDIQQSASRLTLKAMETYYEQLTLILQAKLAQTNDRLSQSMQQFKKLVTEEKWVEEQQTQAEFEDSLTNKQDKFSDKLTNKRAKKLEKLENPEVQSRPPRNIHNDRTHNDNNKGKKTNKKYGGRKHKPSSGNKNRKSDQQTPRQDTHQQGRKENTPRASTDNTVPTTYPPTQPTPTYPPYYASQIPAWPYPP